MTRAVTKLLTKWPEQLELRGDLSKLLSDFLTKLLSDLLSDQSSYSYIVTLVSY